MNLCTYCLLVAVISMTKPGRLHEMCCVTALESPLNGPICQHKRDDMYDTTQTTAEIFRVLKYAGHTKQKENGSRQQLPSFSVILTFCGGLAILCCLRFLYSLFSI
mmetsp:Transcript_9870/g.15237  ORF Transcript_9870/g.15237 Transcript_9870/m.15237 type:complete len:106 (-) Transcript_9870:1001-1318(-)